MNKKIIKSGFLSVVTSLSISFSISAIITFLDWKQNPSEMFHNIDEGTNWEITMATFNSWFIPLFGIIAVALMALKLLVNKLSKRNNA